MAFDVATYRHLPDNVITLRPPAWLFDQYERVQRFRWGEFNQAIMAAETGTARALARAFNKDAKPPALQTYDEMMAEKLQSGPKRLPGWVGKYKEQNKDRRIT